MIYLDNAATTPMSAVAISEMTKVMQETHGNPSSIHSHGRQAGKLLREARQGLSPLTRNQTSTYLFSRLVVQKVTIQPLSAIVSVSKTMENISSPQLLNTILCLRLSIIWCNIFWFEATIIQPVNQEITAQQIQKPYVTIPFSFPPCMLIMKQVASYLSLRLDVF